MAEVFLAKPRDAESFNRLIAVKRILSSISSNREFVDMFVNEAKIAVQLNHANIAQIFELGNVQDAYYIAMEYVHGRDMRAIYDLCGEQAIRIPVPEVCYAMMKVCEGLEYAHNKRDTAGRPMRLVHRDVSPQNVIISFDGDVKVIDFGVAKAAGGLRNTQAGVLKGKFAYMSPEQVRGLPLDRRSDIFSIGVILFEFLCGRRLFWGETDFATLEQVRLAEIPSPRTFNAELDSDIEAIVLRALAKDVDDRYQSAIDLHDDLQAYLYSRGLYTSRKDLAIWLEHHFAAEVALENEKLAAYDRMSWSETIDVIRKRSAETFAEASEGEPRSLLEISPLDGAAASADQRHDGGTAHPLETLATDDQPGDLEWYDEEVDTQIFDKPPSLEQVETDAPPPSEVVVPLAASSLKGRGSRNSGQLPTFSDLLQSGDDAFATVVDRQAPVLEPEPAADEPNPAAAAHEEPSAAEPHDPATVAQGGPAAAEPSPTAAARMEPSAAAPNAAAAPEVPDDVLATLTDSASGLDAPEETSKPVDAIPPAKKTRPSGRRRMTLLLLLLTALLAAGIAYLALAVTERTGRLRVTSKPGGARVYIDGRRYAGRTPMRVEGLDPGLRVVSVRKRGHRSWAKAVDIVSGDELALAVELATLPLGRITVRSRPSGIGVQLDGRPLAGQTPLELAGVPPGIHEVRLSGSADYAPLTREVDLRPEQHLTLDLKLAPRTVRLELTTEPAGAMLLLRRGNDLRSAGRTPLAVDIDSAEDLSLVIRRRGYREWSQPLEFDGRRTIELDVKLERRRR
jgi:serine/threonine protein kinase